MAGGLSMAGAPKILPMVLGAAAIAALAAGGAYFVFDKVSVMPVDAPAKIVELIDKPYTLAQTTDVFDAPKSGGQILLRIRQGASVMVLGIVDGDTWLQIALPDKRIAYIPAATIPGMLSDTQPKALAPAPADTAPATPPAPASATPSAPAADSADSGPEPPPPADLVDFQSIDKAFNVAQATGLYLAPNEHAPQAYVVQPGTKVEVIAVSKDGQWAWVNVTDGAPAYLKLIDLTEAPVDRP
jgi:hypothetical protein